MKYDFEGEHSYVLVRTKNLPNDIPGVYIVGINTHRVDDGDDSEHHDDSSSEENHSRRVRDEEEEDDGGDEEDPDNDSSDSKYDDSEEDKEHHRLQELKIIVYNHTVELRKNRELVVSTK